MTRTIVRIQQTHKKQHNHQTNETAIDATQNVQTLTLAIAQAERKTIFQSQNQCKRKSSQKG